MANNPDPQQAAAPVPAEGRPTTETMIARIWLGLAVRGLLGMLLGIVLILTPAVQMLPFAMLASAVMLLEGVFVVALIVLRIAHARERQEITANLWRLVLAGLVVVCYGALLIRATTMAPVAFTASLGAFTILFGVAMLGLAFRLRPRRNAPPRRTMLAGPML
jgi:uncharacterized membrane protein HdeD (DUF308 family)